MKKVLVLIIGLVLFIPSIIFADMGSPGIEEYKATISNKDGATIYEELDFGEYGITNKKVEYGKTVAITFDDGEYAQVDFDYYIKLSDITLIDKNYKFVDSKWDKASTQIVLKDQEIRKGPANGYDSTGVKIPAGTKVKVRAYLEEMSTWYYVDYNGTKGYIDSYKAKLTTLEASKNFKAYTDIDLVDPVTSKVIRTIKTNTIVSGTYYLLDQWSRSIYLYTENYKGIVPNYGLAIKEETREYTATKDLKVYEKVDLDNQKGVKEIATIKKGTKFTSAYFESYYMDYIIYYEKGNTKGWIYDIPIIKEDEEGFTQEIHGVDWPIDDEESEVVIPDEEEKVEEPIVVDSNEEEEVEEPTPSDAITTEEKKKNDMLYLYIIGALIVCLVAIITIMLINKRKKQD